MRQVQSSLRKGLGNWDNLKATPGFEPGDKGFADLCLTAWLCRRHEYAMFLV